MHKKYLPFVCLMLLFSSINAQINITRTVKTESGIPLAGVDVIMLDSNASDYTAEDGSYSISASSYDAIIHFSLLGY